MSKSDWAFLAFNVVLLFWAFVGFASTDLDTLLVGALVAMFVSAANGIRIIRNRQHQEEREPRAKRSARRRRRSTQDEEMDARTVLDIDARLEALERRERELDEADRIRRLAALGEQAAPADFDLSETTVPAERERV